MGRIWVAAGVVWLGPEAILVGRRPPGGPRGGWWELPGGKIERGEPPAAALARELIEEWGPHADVLQVGPVADVLHHHGTAGGEPEVVLIVYHVDGSAWASRWRDEITPMAGAEVAAVDTADLDPSRFLPADRPLVAAIGAGRTPSPF